MNSEKTLLNTNAEEENMRFHLTLIDALRTALLRIGISMGIMAAILALGTVLLLIAAHFSVLAAVLV